MWGGRIARSRKIEIIYHNGQPDGIKLIRRTLSTMTTYVIPRPLLTEAKKLKGIEEFKGLIISELPKEIVKDEELFTVIYHFVLLEEQKDFLNYDRDLADRLGLVKVGYPNTDKLIDDEILEDAIVMDDLFIAIQENISENKTDTSKVNFKDEIKFTKKQLKVIELYLKGYKQIKIAEILGVNKSAISKIIARYKNRMVK